MKILDLLNTMAAIKEASAAADQKKERKERDTFNDSEQEDKLINDLVELQSTKIKSKTLVIYHDENKDPAKSKLFVNDIGKNIDFLEILRKYQRNLSFPSKSVERILDQVATRSNMKFSNDAVKDDWNETIKRRWRNMCHQIQNSVTNLKGAPKWTKEILPWMKEVKEELDAEEQEEKTDEKSGAEETLELTPTEPNWFYDHDHTSDPPSEEAKPADVGSDDGEKLEQVRDGSIANYEIKFSTEHMLPMRKIKCDGSKKKPPPFELGSIADFKDDDAPLIASWPDGMKVKMEETGAWLTKLQRGSSKSTTQIETLWEQEMKGTKHKIWLKQRTDRHLLLSLYEQEKQIAQTSVAIFGEVILKDGCNHLPPEDPAIVAALSVMKPLGIMYANGEIQRTELKTIKDRRVKEWQTENKTKIKTVTKEEQEKDDQTSKGSNQKRKKSIKTEVASSSAAKIETDEVKKAEPIDAEEQKTSSLKKIKLEHDPGSPFPSSMRAASGPPIKSSLQCLETCDPSESSQLMDFDDL